MKVFELFERDLLFELREYLDTNFYGSWIHPDGTVDDVDKHADWLEAYYGESDTYDQAFKDGFIRVIHPQLTGGTSTNSNSLHLMGKPENIRKQFRIWWPTAQSSDKVVIDDENWLKLGIYDMPQDRLELLKIWRPK